MSQSLSEFYIQYEPKTDKGTIHDYINAWYSTEFTPKRFDVLSIVEIGVKRGYSAKLWSDWFVNSNIFGIDNFSENQFEKENILKEVYKLNNFTFIENNAYDLNTINLFQDNSIDYLIDDGPHSDETQLFCLEHWFKKIKIGGKLIIEDIQDIERQKNDFDKLCVKMNIKYDIIDLRLNKNREDDILLIFTKYE
jgi:hypothetical protein